MADIIGVVQPDGRIAIQEDVHLQPGQTVRVTVLPESSEEIKTYSISLEEAKKRLANEPQLTEEQWAEVGRAYDMLTIAAEDTGLPDDYADELDHYLYGTPRRKPKE